MQTEPRLECVDAELGKLLFLYELGQLDNRDREQFEAHLLRCDFCLHQITEKLPIITVFLQKREHIREALQKEGLDYRSQLRKLAEVRREQRPKKSFWANWWDITVTIIQEIGRPKVWIPITAAAVLFFILFLPQGPAPDNPYLAYLSFDKLLYNPAQTRLGLETDAERSFQAGMERYHQGNFNAAISELKNAVEGSPTKGHWWLYLGVSYYLDHQAQPAIEALTQADSLTQYPLKSHAEWYLAQAYLLAGNVQRAMPLLQALDDQNREYSNEANALLMRIGSVIRK